MSLSNLTPPLPVFLSAIQSGDGAMLRGTIGQDAVLADDGQEHRGDDVARWIEDLSRSCGRFLPINEARRDGQVVITILTEEDDADGVVAEILRDWCFRIGEGRILGIAIERRPAPVLPPAVAAYIRATNRFDLDGLLATFVDDALVNDQLHDHWGKQVIRKWAERDIVGARLTMHIVSATQHYDHVIVTANINGDFDMRGLPDPLCLSFYFSTRADRIVQLIILRNQSGI
ncbi:MAG: hypothetical protein WDN25_24240 [Acetobacteraceae bacterium]